MSIEGTSKRPYLQLSLLYQRLGIDELGGPIYLGLFDNIQGPFPLQILFVVSNQYTNGFGMHRQYTQITGPDGEEIAQSPESTFHMQSLIGGSRIDERFGVAFTKEGRYTIRVSLDGQLAIEYYFMVREAKPQVAGGAP